MMYQNKLVAVVKVDGKVLRENDGTVIIPFGSEYAVLLKNLSTVRMQVKVSIDGTDATEDTWLVINPNSSIELERFIKGGNLNSGNRLKFIERTQQIEGHRGIKADDGLIRIEYQVEKVRPVVDVPVIRRHYYDYYEPWYTPYYPPYVPKWPSPYRWEITCNNTALDSTLTNCSVNTVHSSGSLKAMNFCKSSPSNDAGITVAGSHSNQKFVPVSSFEVGESDVLIIRLRGSVNNVRATKAITTAQKKQCSTCGKKSKSGESFCGRCGTALNQY